MSNEPTGGVPLPEPEVQRILRTAKGVEDQVNEKLGLEVAAYVLPLSLRPPGPPRADQFGDKPVVYGHEGQAGVILTVALQ